MGILTITQGEEYTHVHPIKVQITESDGTPVVLTGTTITVYLKSEAQMISTSGLLSGSSWDDSANGKFHYKLTAEETGAFVGQDGYQRIKVVFSGGAIRYTADASIKIRRTWE